MKLSLLFFSAIVAALMPLGVAAQSNIIKAFDDIINNKNAVIVATHSLDKDPETNTKTGQSDVYRFTLPAKDIKLVKNVIAAFEKDSDMAYSLNNGKCNNEATLGLSVGDGSAPGIYINNITGDYIYALFLAPNTEDPEGYYRYAYGMNYKEEDGEIKGSLIITYALTLARRQALEQEQRSDALKRLSADTSSVHFPSKLLPWFDQVMGCIQAMPSANSAVQIALATRVFNLIGNVNRYPDVTDVQKTTIYNILQNMSGDSRYNRDPILSPLITQSMSALK